MNENSMNKKVDEKLNFRNMQEITWNKTINIYVENLKKTEEILNTLLKEKEVKHIAQSINTLQNDINTYVTSALNPEYQIAIVGAIKAGKSTLINSLIGDDLVSVDVTPETATLTKIKSSDSSYIKVSFYNDYEWQKIWKQANNPEKKATVFLKEYNEIKAEERKKDLINKKEIIFMSENLDELKSEIKKWTSSKTKEHYFVKEIEIGLKKLDLDKQICIVDTPGLNDVVAYRSNITLDYIDRANAIIICINAKTLRSEEMLTIAKVFSRARHKKDKIYILGTQIDTLNSTRDWTKQKKEWEKYLYADEYFNKKELIESNVIGISAYLYNMLRSEIINRSIIGKYEQLDLITESESDELRKLMKRGIGLTIGLTESIKNKILTFSNINKIKNVVFDRLIKQYNKFLLEDYIANYNLINKKLINFKDENIKQFREVLDATKLSQNELEHAISSKKQEIEKMKNRIKRISTDIDNVNTSFNVDFNQLEDEFNKIKESIKKINIE